MVIDNIEEIGGAVDDLTTALKETNSLLSELVKIKKQQFEAWETHVVKRPPIVNPVHR